MDCGHGRTLIKGVFGWDGPTIPQECHIRDDSTLAWFTRVVYFTMFLGVLWYACFEVTLSQSMPASVWVEHIITPHHRIDNGIGRYCDHPSEYNCPATGVGVNATGCVKFPPSVSHFPITDVPSNVGTGVFIPTLWHYERIALRPRVGVSRCEDLEASARCTESDDDKDLCHCAEKKERLFLPFDKFEMLLRLQIHMEIPNLQVMNPTSPLCRNFYKSKTTDGGEDECNDFNENEHGHRACLWDKYRVSSMPCEVRMQVPRQQNKWMNLNKNDFWTSRWGALFYNLSGLLERVTDVSAPSTFNEQNSRDPAKCSFMSTGGSFIFKHWVEPNPPERSFMTPQSFVCRFAHPFLIRMLHSRHDGEWPCFKLRVDVYYVPSFRINKWETVIEDATKGHLRYEKQFHKGVRISATGESGYVLRSTLTSAVVGLMSVVAIWRFRLTIVQAILLFGLSGPRGVLYRRAVVPSISVKKMISAWVCRSVTALWTLKAAEKLENSSHEKAEAMVVETLSALIQREGVRKPRSGPLCSREVELGDDEKEKVETFGRALVHNGTKGTLGESEDETPKELSGLDPLERWLLANECSGEVTSTDIHNMVGYGAETWGHLDAPALVAAGADITLAPM
eukprot:s108_g4.t2